MDSVVMDLVNLMNGLMALVVMDGLCWISWAVWNVEIHQESGRAQCNTAIGNTGDNFN